MTDIDVDARISIRQLQEQMGGSAEFDTIGRRSYTNVEVHSTKVVSTNDTTNTFFVGARGVVGSGCTIGHDPTNSVIVYVLNDDDEFLELFSHNGFVDTTQTTATLDTTSNSVTF